MNLPNRYFVRLDDPPDDADWEKALAAVRSEEWKQFLRDLWSAGDRGLPARLLWSRYESIFRLRMTAPNALVTLNAALARHGLDLRVLPLPGTTYDPWTIRRVRLYRVSPKKK